MEKSRQVRHRIEWGLKFVGLTIFLFLIFEFFAHRSEIYSLQYRLDDLHRLTDKKIFYLEREKTNLNSHINQMSSNFQELSKNQKLQQERVKVFEADLVLCKGKLEDSDRNCTQIVSQSRNERTVNERKISELTDTVTSLEDDIEKLKAQLNFCRQNTKQESSIQKNGDFVKPKEEYKSKDLEGPNLNEEQNHHRPVEEHRPWIPPVVEEKFRSKTFSPFLAKQIELAHKNENEQQFIVKTASIPTPTSTVFNFAALRRRDNVKDSFFDPSHDGEKKEQGEILQRSRE